MFVCGASSAWVACVLLMLLEVAVNPTWSSSSSWGGPFWLVHWEYRQPAGTTEPGTLMLSAFYFSPTLWVFLFISYPDTSAWRSHCYLLPTSSEIFSKTLFFKNIFRFPTKSRRTEIFHILPASLHTSPTVHIPYQSGTFVSTDEPTQTHHSHPKSIVSIRAHSWCCIFSGFGYTCNDTYPLL